MPSVALRWTDWSTDPLVLAALAASAGAYLAIARRFPPRRRQPLAFWAGEAALVLALLSPLDAGAAYLFTVHMLQHMLLLLIAAALFALAVPPGLIGWAYSRPAVRRVVRAVWRPGPAFVLFNGTLLAWHIPAAYDATLRIAWVHAVEHVTFVVTGVIFWGVIVSPAPALVRAPLGVRFALLIGADIVNFILGFALTFAGRPLYPAYTAAPRVWGLSPLDDLHLGGVLMWVMGQMMYLIPVLILLNVILWRDGGRDRLPPYGDLRRPAMPGESARRGRDGGARSATGMLS
ncbi:MAG TPA: cytochrome c oxidase assembly protein [bacterium]|nr:cytochrome c oxidase assembly protein [bacterium]